MYKHMIKEKQEKKYRALAETLLIDCETCSGLCCVALYCIKTDGFPADKEAGRPCQHLQPDFRCAIHTGLAERKLKGCLAYDCFGAGQKTTQLYEQKGSWQESPEGAEEMFATFMTVFQLHQMLWYLVEAYSLTVDQGLISEIDGLITEYEEMISRPLSEIPSLSIAHYRSRVNEVLKQIIRSVSPHCSVKKQNTDYFGKDLRKINLAGRDLSMSLLIAANLAGCSLQRTIFLGADLRDANIRDADLSESLFLTQMQVNSAKGNTNTKLPVNLSHPATW